MKKTVFSLVLFTLFTTLLSVAVSADTMTMYAADGRVIEIDVSEAEMYANVGWYYAPVVTIYKPDGTESLVYAYELNYYTRHGWYTKPVTYVYHPEHGQDVVTKEGMASRICTGWYNYPVSKVYSLDGRCEVIKTDELESYINVGWYEEPMAKLYGYNGQTLIVPLRAVSYYRQFGWKPFHDFVMNSTLKDITSTFGNLNFQSYYPGTPGTGDIPLNFYSNSSNNDPHFIFIGFETKAYIGRPKTYCVHSFSTDIKTVFPYLSMYADHNGIISRKTLANVLGDGGIYGKKYRYPHDDFGVWTSYSEPEVFDETLYFDYDRISISINCDYYGNIDLNTAACHFYYCY